MQYEPAHAMAASEAQCDRPVLTHQICSAEMMLRANLRSHLKEVLVSSLIFYDLFLRGVRRRKLRVGQLVISMKALTGSYHGTVSWPIVHAGSKIEFNLLISLVGLIALRSDQRVLEQASRCQQNKYQGSYYDWTDEFPRFIRFFCLTSSIQKNIWIHDEFFLTISDVQISIGSFQEIKIEEIYSQSS